MRNFISRFLFLTMLAAGIIGSSVYAGEEEVAIFRNAFKKEVHKDNLKLDTILEHIIKKTNDGFVPKLIKALKVNIKDYENNKLILKELHKLIGILDDLSKCHFWSGEGGGSFEYSNEKLYSTANKINSKLNVLDELITKRVKIESALRKVNHSKTYEALYHSEKTYEALFAEN